MILDFILAVVFLTLAWAATDKWILRQQIQWKLNMGVAFFFSLIHFTWNVQGGYQMTYLFAPVLLFIAGYYVAVLYHRVKDSKLFQDALNKNGCGFALGGNTKTEAQNAPKQEKKAESSN